MSKADGLYIGVKFTEPLVGDVSGLTPTPVAGYGSAKVDISSATVTALNQYSDSYTKTNTIDKNLATFWRGTTAINWIAYQLSSAIILTKLRLYMGSYYITSFNISGSNNGTTWTQIGGTLTGASTSTLQWYEYVLDNNIAYLYYKIDTLTAYSTRIYLYEVEMFEKMPLGNEYYFTISGQEYNFVPNGQLGNKVYKAKSVTVHPTESNSILVQVEALSKFCSVAGNLTIAYAGGNLTGEGGPVSAFTQVLAPQDLVPKPHQNDQEHINISINSVSTLLHIYYTSTQNGADHIDIVNITATGTLTNINDL